MSAYDMRISNWRSDVCSSDLKSGRLIVVGVALQADVSGALVWPERRLAAVADLHFEKATAFAARGQLLPPYDPTATLDKLEDVIARHGIERVLCLGDSFHDGAAAARLDPAPAHRPTGLRARLHTSAARCVGKEGGSTSRP